MASFGEQTSNCDKTGLDLSGVDVNDAHANFGYHPECQVWGVDFQPWWGVWSPPDNQPSCAGGRGRCERRGRRLRPRSRRDRRAGAGGA